ncbi:hypothetical protein KKG05_06910, partial [bacterium]|nr:hypothetical protein [bacterium]
MKAPGVIIPRHYFNEAELEQLFDLAPNLMPCIYADKENIDIECFYVNWLYSYVQRYRISSFRSLKKHFKKEKFHEGCVN